MAAETGAVNAAQIAAAIKRLGLDGKPLMVHASLRSFGRVDGGAEAVADGLLAAGCTMMAPAFTGGYAVPPPPDMRPARNGRDYAGVVYHPGVETCIYTVDTNEIDRHRMGAIAEAVVGRPGRARGDHPLCSMAALGPLAEALVADQGPLAVFAPFDALAARGGWVMLMGVWLNRLTLLHHAEGLAGRYLFRWCALDRDGQPMAVTGGGCSGGFVNLAPYLTPLMRRTTVGACVWSAFPAQETLSVAAEVIRQRPQITHCGDPDCRSCHDAVLGGPVL